LILSNARDDYSDITRLELVGRMRRYATKYDIILEAKLGDLKQLMRSKNIGDHKLQPIEANLQVCVAVTMEDMRKLRPSCSN
jgi:hypothetical protein